MGGVEGYRLLAGVWSESDIVGGAFWTIIDSDPYTGTDIVHPPFWGDHPPDVEHESWGEGDYLWDETAWLEPGAYQITFWANPDELDPYGRLIPAGLIERECQVTVEVTAGHTTEVTISDIPMAGEGGECQRATDDTSVRFITFTPVQWGIILDDDRPGVHTVLMEVDARPLTAREIEDVSGRLIWDEVTVDLCNIGIDRPDGSLQIGDIFQTTEGCGPNPTAMRDAFEEFGLPEKGCLTATVGGVDHEYCAPLRATEDAFVGPEPGTVTLVLDGLEGFEGLAVDALVVPSLEDERDELAVLGEMYFGVIDIDSYSGSDVMHPQSYRDFGVAFDEVAIFPPGTYRFIIEAYVPSGDMYYGCEQQIQVVDGIPTIVSFTSLPTYTGDGWHWTPYDQLEYPDCP